MVGLEPGCNFRESMATPCHAPMLVDLSVTISKFKAAKDGRMQTFAVNLFMIINGFVDGGQRSVSTNDSKPVSMMTPAAPTEWPT
jgi:hypothetical protein